MLPNGEACSSSGSDGRPIQEDDALELSLSLGRQPCHGTTLKAAAPRQPDSGRSNPNPRALNGSEQPHAIGSRLTSAEIWHSIQESSPGVDIAQTPFAPKGAPARSASLQFVDPQRGPIYLQPSSGCTESMQNKISHMELQETQELQRHKEMEAQRRQEARKRRKCLIEEKQLRKARRDEAKFLSPRHAQPCRTSSNSAAMMQHLGCFQSRAGEGLRRELSLPVNIKQMSVSSEVENRKAKTGDEYADGRKIEEAKKDAADELPNKTYVPEVNAKAADSSISISYEKFQSKQDKDNDLQNQTLGSEKHAQDCESRPTLQDDSAKISGAATNTSLPHATSAFPLFPAPYSFSIPGSDSATLPLQMGFSLPYFVHLLQSRYQGSKDSSDLTGSKLPFPFQPPVCSGFPMPEACIPWLSGALSQATSNVASWGKCNQSTGSDQSSSNETHSRNAELLSDSVQGETSITARNCPSGCIIPKPRKLCARLPDDISRRAFTKFGLSRTVSDSEVQLGLLHTVSDSSAWLGFIHSLFKSGREAHREEGNGDPFISEAAACPETSQDLCRSHPATQDPAEESETMATLSHGEENHCMAAKGSSLHSTIVDPMASEVCDSECGSGSLTVDDNLGKEILKLQEDLTIKGKSGETGSFSDLRRVSTTGPGPNGRTVTGYMYIFNKYNVKIVCSCHSTHMSPSEFVQHAGYTDLSNPERNIIVKPSPCVR